MLSIATSSRLRFSSAPRPIVPDVLHGARACASKPWLQHQAQASTLVVKAVTDATVPEGHKGLHQTLYGEGGAEGEHASANYSIRQDEDDGSKLIPVAEYIDARDGEKPFGVYALYDSAQKAQYIGYSRNMVLSVKTHLKRVGPERCAFVRVMVFANRAMATRQNLEREVVNWVEECAEPPPGNGPDRGLWEGTGDATMSVDLSVMSDAERNEYEEKKLKMKKALGENLHDGMEGAPESDAQRREKMMAALNNDDWSAVIDGQTKATIQGGGSAADASQQVVSPFTQARVHRSVGESTMDAEAPPTLMTVESVDKALEQVRPYLIADGGNVEVADVAAGVVFLRLSGACNTCTSSATTMRMGIERSLKATFGEQLKEVVQVGGTETVVATVTTIDAHLDNLRAAIHGVGGKVQVVDVQKGTCLLKYKGPAAMGQGIAAAIKDTFPRDIKEVLLVSF